MVALPQTTCYSCFGRSRFLLCRHLCQNLLFVRPREKAKMKLRVASAAAPDYLGMPQAIVNALQRRAAPTNYCSDTRTMTVL
jgi:hypothetical protein